MIRKSRAMRVRLCAMTVSATLSITLADSEVGHCSELDETETETASDYHRGLFMRVTLGPRYSSTSRSKRNIDVSGFGGYAAMRIGGTIAPKTALHFTSLVQTVISPSITLDAVELEEDNLDNIISRTFGFGVGASHYFADNFFVESSLLASVFILEFFGDGFSVEQSSDLGLGLTLSVGKEWYVGKKAAVGVAGEGLWAFIPDGDNKGNWTGAGFSINLSFTYH